MDLRCHSGVWSSDDVVCLDEGALHCLALPYGLVRIEMKQPIAGEMLFLGCGGCP